MTIDELYGELRAEVLSRHFALGRYFRADHLSFSNYLGVVHTNSSTTPDTGNDLIHGCLGSTATLVRPSSVYADSAELLTLMPPDLQLFERWRVADHSRANPLMYSGQLMTCLAVETLLGQPGSQEVLSRLLSTTGSLFKFTTQPWDGYILRWDPATSDHWSTVQGENEVWLDQSCDFLTDSDQPTGYLHCTPLDDPRYQPYITQSEFDGLGGKVQQEEYWNRRQLSVEMLRSWEPSFDELTGLLAGYSFVSTVVSDPAIQSQIRDQVDRIGRYLAANAYLLVRPGGGFAAQGASGVGPALEFPFGRVFSRITGSAHTAQTSFEGALQNAGMWPKFSLAFRAASLFGPIIGILAFPIIVVMALAMGGLLGGIIIATGGVGTFISIVGGGALAKALILYLGCEAFDVKATPNSPSLGLKANHGSQQEFAVAYLLSQLNSQTRFTSWIWAAARFGKRIVPGAPGPRSGNFPPFLGLSAIGDPDPTVAGSFLDWLTARRARHDETGDDAQEDLTANEDAFASAVAVALGAGPAEQSKLVSLLTTLAAEFDSKRADHMAIFDDENALVIEPLRPTLNFLSAVALARYFSKVQADAGTPVQVPGFPAAPPAGKPLPAVTIPADVVAGTYGSPTPQQVIPLEALPPLPTPLKGDIDLFGPGVPHKPANAPAPLTTVRWLWTGATSHSGLFGSSAHDTINAGKTLIGSGATILGVLLQLVDKHGVPLGGLTTTTRFGRPDAAVGTWPSTAGARIVSDPSGSNVETVTVFWWFDFGRACRYRIGYLVQGAGASL
jgi:hypothetical protein